MVIRCVCTPIPYILSSGAAGLVGIFMTMQIRAADPRMHTELTLHVLVAVVMGGTIMGSGFGNLCGALLAATAITVGQIVCNLTNLGHANQMVFLALTLLPAAGLLVLYDFLFDLVHRHRHSPQQQAPNPFPPADRHDAGD